MQTEAIQHWQQLVGKSEQGIAVIDPHGQFLYSNAAYRAIFGVSDDVTNIFQLVNAGQEDEMQQLLDDTLSGKTTPLFHSHSQRHDTGAWCDTRVTAHPFFDEQGTSIGCVILLYDVTHEQEIRRLKAEVFALTTHELKTPLTVIRGTVQSLKRRIRQRGLPERDTLLEELDLLERNTDKLMQRVDALEKEYRSDDNE